MSTNPQDLLFVLGKLDGKLDGIQANLQSIARRADGLESRIGNMEVDIAKLLSKETAYGERIEHLEDKVSILSVWKAEHAGMEKKAKRLQGFLQVLLGASIPVLLWLGNNFLS